MTTESRSAEPLWPPRPVERCWLCALWVAILYAGTGFLGLQLSGDTPFATLVWPPSGIALASLLCWGRGVWPGILAGSFVLNLMLTSNALTAHSISVAAAIAAGSTAQAFVGHLALTRVYGLPLQLRGWLAAFGMAVMAGPLVCLMSASVAHLALWLVGIVPAQQLQQSWMKWWLGDTLGVLLFVPWALMLPTSRPICLWRGRRISPRAALPGLMLVAALFSAWYAWVWGSERWRREGAGKHVAVMEQAERDILQRVGRIDAVLKGAADVMTTQGMSDAGRQQALDAFLGSMRASEQYQVVSSLRWWPARNTANVGVASVAEGLDASEPIVLAMQDSARLGRPVLSALMSSVQAKGRGVQAVYIRPVYSTPIAGEPSMSKLLGWVGVRLHMDLLFRVGDVGGDIPWVLSAHDVTQGDLTPFGHLNLGERGSLWSGLSSGERTLLIGERKWSIKVFYPEAAAFFRAEGVTGGLLFLGLGGLSVLSWGLVRWRRAGIGRAPGEGALSILLPVVAFFFVFGASVTLAFVLRERERLHLKSLVESEANNVALLLSAQIGDATWTMRQMALRWSRSERTNDALWEIEAQGLVDEVPGLKGIAWFDETGQIRKWNVGLGVAGNPWLTQGGIEGRVRKDAFSGDSSWPVIAEPLVDANLAHATFVSVAIKEQGRLRGHLSWYLDLSSVFALALDVSFSEKYQLELARNGQVHFQSRVKGELVSSVRDVSAERGVDFLGQKWDMRLRPTAAFSETQTGMLPTLMLVAGGVISWLVALLVRSVMVHRLKSEHLHRSSQVNRAILSSVPHLIIATDAKGVVKSFNSAAENALGYSSAEVVDKVTPALWHDSTEVCQRAEALAREYGEYIEPGFGVFTYKALKEGWDQAEWTFVRRDGSRFPVSLTVSPMYALDGMVSGYVGVIEDIADRLFREEALRTSEETFRSALENASTGMALMDASGHWIKVNRSLCDLLGRSASTLLGRDIREVLRSDELSSFDQQLQQTIAGDQTEFQWETHFLGADEHMLTVVLSVALVRCADGKPNYFVVQIQDVTARKEMDRVKDEFISVVSHELRTPLTSIRGSLGLIVGGMSKEVSDRVMRLITIAASNCERLILLINDILDIDKIASGKMEFDLKPERLSLLMQDVAQANRPLADKAGVTLALDGMDASDLVMVDASRVVQVVTNLLSNAIKFSPSGQTVTLQLQESSGLVRLSVIDRGEGIAEEFKDRIFGKFAQADSTVTRSKGGSGLGLHISKILVEKMGGEIGFDSTPGQGSTFWMTFPLLTDVSSSPEVAGLPPPSVLGAHADHRIPNVLHVEDDADFRSVLKTAMHGQANCVGVGHLKEAEALLRQQAFDLIVLDDGLPDGSGVQFARRLPELGLKPCPVAILSAGDVSLEDRRKVSATMIKSKTPDALIVETILRLTRDRKDEPAVPVS